ncbi:MAG TPA: HTH domain-containing protein [Streptosporangiaceae bacterium]|jgi:hypothetical protein
MNAPVTAVGGWREEMRRDRLAAARIDREREAARAQLRITTRHARAAARREDAQARAAARQQARKARLARRAARLGWLRAHTVDLLFVPVIGVPAVLAWTAMAAYGQLLYGPAGLLLPAFSEGAMWAFAAATTLTRRLWPARPVWHLRTGTAVFAGVGAALNFAHGVTAAAGPRGPVPGVVYAVVSVAGVSVHQFVTAGPRRSRAERATARIARAVARREMAARRAALRAAVTAIDGHGNARLAYQPGPAHLGRHRGRLHLTPADSGSPPPSLALAGPACPWPGPAPVLPAAGQAPDTPPDSAADTARPPRRTPARTSRRTARPDTAAAVARLRGRHPDMSTADIAARLGISDRTVRRHLARPADTPAAPAAA